MMSRSPILRTTNLEQQHSLSTSKEDLSQFTNYCFRCGKKLIVLPILGFALLSVGLLLGIGSYSVRNVTNSFAQVESKIPPFATGVLMILTGINLMTLFKTRPRCLVVISVVLSCMSGLLCFNGAVHTLTEVTPMFSRFDGCQYFIKGRMCKCFTQNSLRQVSYFFKETENCKAVQTSLRDLVYGVCGIYSLGFALTLLASLSVCTLFWPTSISKVVMHSRYEGDGRCTVTSRQSQTSQTNLSTLRDSRLELPTAAVDQTSVATQTVAQTSTQFVRSSSSCSPRSHYVVDMNMSRTDFCVNFETPERHDPPPPYSERP